MPTFVKGAMVIAALLVTFMVLAPRAWGGDEDETPQSDSVTSPVPDDQWSPEVRLWLARSILGEVGWMRLDEQAAVAWVYATRAKASQRHTFIEMVKTYSAALKTRHRNPWLFELNEAGDRPRSWPVGDGGKGPRWSGLHDKAWSKTLDLVDRWKAGDVPNPCPGANHFGGYEDEHRARRERWARVKCSVKTRNRFYTSLRLTSVPEHVSIPGYRP